MSKPALLFVSGPGVAFRHMPGLFTTWEASFDVVHWDQPGADASPLTLGRLTAEGVAVAEAALAECGQRRLALMGVSGGSVVGLMMAKARPDLFSVVVGSGQFVDWARQAELSYRLILSQARGRGDANAVAELEQAGPPPYADLAAEAVKAKFAGALTPAELAALDPTQQPPAGTRERAMAAYAALRPELTIFDARALGRRIEVPLVFLQGEADAYSVTSEVEAYAAWVEAPHAAVHVIAGGGHSAFMLGQPFAEALAAHALPLVQP